jgi:agmatine/peptidylarginine deiminase
MQQGKYSFLCGLIMLVLMVPLHAQQSPNARFHKPAYRTEAEKQLHSSSVTLNKTWLGKAFPADLVVPGEFEESQAVVISWSFDYNVLGNVIGVDTFSVYGDVSAQLADAIQKECQVWIRVPRAQDTAVVKREMARRGKPLVNYRFFVQMGDDWWARDFGPIGFYYSGSDSVGFADMKYYDGRDSDNVFPQRLADAAGYPNYVTRLYGEGGNLMADGFGSMFFSNVIQDENAPWSNSQTLDTMERVFRSPVLANLKMLHCDGGTGHIDMYLKLIDEQTIIAARYPDTIKSTDKQIIEDNYQYLLTLKSTYNRPFRIIRIEDPTDDDGRYHHLTCTQLDSDARTFVNGLTVNNTYIYPTYSDGSTGNYGQHQRVLQFYRKIMPGYTMVPIDSRDLSPLGGAIHCITMQIPAENPIRFWHPSVDGIQPALPKYHIVAKVTNKDGIASAHCFWRKNGAGWNDVTLADSAGYFIGDIVSNGMAGTDRIEYYLKATSNNGKTMTKPITAGNGGYYSILLEYAAGMPQAVESADHVFTAFPNPAASSVTLRYKLLEASPATLEIYDLAGKLVYHKNTEGVQGMNEENIRLDEWPGGIYFYMLSANGVNIGTKKLVVMR